MLPLGGSLALGHVIRYSSMAEGHSTVSEGDFDPELLACVNCNIVQIALAHTHVTM